MSVPPEPPPRPSIRSNAPPPLRLNPRFPGGESTDFPVIRRISPPLVQPRSRCGPRTKGSLLYQGLRADSDPRRRGLRQSGRGKDPHSLPSLAKWGRVPEQSEGGRGQPASLHRRDEACRELETAPSAEKHSGSQYRRVIPAPQPLRSGHPSGCLRLRHSVGEAKARLLGEKRKAHPSNRVVLVRVDEDDRLPRAESEAALEHGNGGERGDEPRHYVVGSVTR